MRYQFNRPNVDLARSLQSFNFKIKCSTTGDEIIPSKGQTSWAAWIDAFNLVIEPRLTGKSKALRTGSCPIVHLQFPCSESPWQP